MLFKIVLKDAKICYDVMQNIFQDSWLYKIHIIWPTQEREREREREINNTINDEHSKLMQFQLEMLVRENLWFL